MGAVGEEGDARPRAQPMQHRIEPVRRAVQVKGIGCADDDVDLAVQQSAEPRPVLLQPVGDVVIVAPIGDDCRVHRASRPVEDLHGPPVRAPGREDPVEGRELAAIGAEHRLQLGELAQGGDHPAMVADQRPLAAVGGDIGIGVGCIEVDAGEIVEVARVRRGRPGAAEDRRIASLQPERRPAAGAVPGQEAARSTPVHPIGPLQPGDQFLGQRRAPGAVIGAVGEFVRAGGRAVVERDPDHRRIMAGVHFQAGHCGDVARGQEVRAEAAGRIDHREVRSVRLVARRQHDPAAHMDGPAPESGEPGAHEVDSDGAIVGGLRGCGLAR